MEPLNSEVYEELKQASPTIKYYFLYNERTNNDRRNETDLCINRDKRSAQYYLCYRFMHIDRQTTDEIERVFEELEGAVDAHYEVMEDFYTNFP